MNEGPAIERSSGFALDRLPAQPEMQIHAATIGFRGATGVDPPGHGRVEMRLVACPILVTNVQMEFMVVVADQGADGLSRQALLQVGPLDEDYVVVRYPDVTFGNA